MIGRISDTVSSATSTIQDTWAKSTKTFCDKLNVTDNYNHLSNKLNDNFEKFSKQYPGVTESLINTKLTLNNGTEYIRSIPASVGGTVYSYVPTVPTIQLVDASDEEIIRPQPNNSLAENVIPLNEERVELVNHILDLYSYKQSKESFKYYDEEVVYEDQLLYTKGLSNLKAQFYGVTKLLKSTTVDYKVLENTLTVLRISLNQKYDLPFFKKAFILNSIIVLGFDGEGKKITRHSDLLLGKHPVYGGEIFRKGAGKIVSTFVKVPEVPEVPENQ